MQSSPSLAPAPPISSLFSSLPILLPSLDPPGSIFVESETYVPDSLWLDQTLGDSDVDKLEDHFEMQDLTLGHPMGFDFHISMIGSAKVFSPPFLEMLDFIYVIHPLSMVYAFL